MQPSIQKLSLIPGVPRRDSRHFTATHSFAFGFLIYSFKAHSLPRFSAPFQTISGAHPHSCVMVTASLSPVKSGRDIALTTQSDIARGYRKSRAIPPFPLWTLIAACRLDFVFVFTFTSTFTFTFYICIFFRSFFVSVLCYSDIFIFGTQLSKGTQNYSYKIR